MDVDDFKKIIRGLTEEDITADEPHVSMRCDENNVTLEDVKRIILDENANLIRIIEDRPKVYKLYYRISKNVELKVVIDMFTYPLLNIRTVKRLVQKFKIGLVRRRF